MTKCAGIYVFIINNFIVPDKIKRNIVPETITSHARCKSDEKRLEVTENINFDIKKYTGNITLKPVDLKAKMNIPRKSNTDFGDKDYDYYNLNKFHEGSWVVVKLGIYYYIAKIVAIQWNMYKVLGLKKIKKRLFDWCDIAEEDTITETHIVCELEEPKVHDTGALIFNNLPDLNYI